MSGPWLRGATAAGLNAAALGIAASASGVRGGLLVLAAAAFAFSEAFSQRDDGRVERGDPWAWAMGLALYGTLVAALALPGETSVALSVAGGGLMIGAVALRRAAIGALGAGFINEVQPGALVTTGVYRRLRHPSEAGTLCFTLGAVAMTGSAVGALLWLSLILPGVLWRVHREEAALHRLHGAPYARYSAETGALLPV